MPSARLTVALALAFCSFALSAYAVFGASGTKGQSVSQAAYQYLKDLAKQNSLAIDSERVVAVRETGNSAVVRIRVLYHQLFELAPGTKPLTGPMTWATLVVHLHRGGWSIGYAELAR